MPKGIRYGGRQKNTPNKTSLAKEAWYAKQGIMPVEFMLGTMRDPEKPFDVRYKAAVDVAPYVHPRLQAIAVAPASTQDIDRWLLDARRLTSDQRDYLRQLIEQTIEGEARVIEDRSESDR